MVSLTTVNNELVPMDSDVDSNASPACKAFKALSILVQLCDRDVSDRTEKTGNMYGLKLLPQLTTLVQYEPEQAMQVMLCTMWLIRYTTMVLIMGL